MAVGPSRQPARPGLPDRHQRRPAAGRRQRRAGRRPQDSGNRGDARHACHLSRRSDRLCRRPTDFGNDPAAGLRGVRPQQCSGSLATHLDRHRVDTAAWSFGALHAYRTQRLRGRQQQRGRRVCRHQHEIAHRLSVLAVRRPVRSDRRAVGRALRHDRRRHRARPAAADHIGRRRRRREHLRRQRLGLWRRHRRRHLRRAAERRAASRHGSVLAAGDDRRGHPRHGDPVQPHHRA